MIASGMVNFYPAHISFWKSLLSPFMEIFQRMWSSGWSKCWRTTGAFLWWLVLRNLLWIEVIHIIVVEKFGADSGWNADMFSLLRLFRVLLQLASQGFSWKCKWKEMKLELCWFPCYLSSELVYGYGAASILLSSTKGKNFQMFAKLAGKIM